MVLINAFTFAMVWCLRFQWHLLGYFCSIYFPDIDIHQPQSLLPHWWWNRFSFQSVLELEPWALWILGRRATHWAILRPLGLVWMSKFILHSPVYYLATSGNWNSSSHLPRWLLKITVCRLQWHSNCGSQWWPNEEEFLTKETDYRPHEINHVLPTFTSALLGKSTTPSTKAATKYLTQVAHGHTCLLSLPWAHFCPIPNLPT